MSKHQEVIAYIKGLSEGDRISVRNVADSQNVSEGTAYKAIKEAERLGIVTTIPRVGTIRVDRIDKRNIENLNCNEVVNIVTGKVLGGKAGLYKTINNFIIGAMTVDAMGNYLGENDLLISGNREESHKLALEKECAVLITGGFVCSDYIKRLADRKQLPIISCQYDTFTTATLINNAISQRQIKSDIIVAEDIMKTNFMFLDSFSTIKDLKVMSLVSEDEYFYVIDEKGRLLGSIKYDEKKHTDESSSISSFIEKNLVCVTTKTSASYAGHILTKNEVTRLPVLEGKRMVGILLKEDIEKAVKILGQRRKTNQTVEDLLIKSFNKEKTDSGVIYRGNIQPEMLNAIGIASWSILNFIMSITGITALKDHKIYNIVVETFNVIFIKPLQMDAMVEAKGEIIDVGKNSAKVEITLTSASELIGKAYLTTKMLGK